MKKIYIKLMLILFICSGLLNNAHAQAPEGIIYQAEARDDRGKIIANSELDVKITILEDVLADVWIGHHEVTTNEYGMFVLVIGTGTDNKGYVFENINWGSGTFFLNVGVKKPKKTDYVDMGTTQLLSVPYALHAKTAETVLNNQDISGIAINATAISDEITRAIAAEATNTATITTHITTDADTDPSNELQDWTTLPGIPDDIADGIDHVDDADADAKNELNTSVVLIGTDLEVTDAGGTKSADLSSLITGGGGDCSSCDILLNFLIITEDGVNLYNAGVSLSDLLSAGKNVSDLFNAGASVADLLTAGASVSDLFNAGASVADLLTAGASVSDLFNVGVGVGTLEQYGVDPKVLADAGLIGTVDDQDGNTYKWVKIGTQVWMAENLKTTHYADGTLISGVYDNGIDYVNTYGRSYMWDAAMNNSASGNANPSGVQGVCPNSWHIPSDAEWTELNDFLAAHSDNLNTQGTLLKSTSGWEPIWTNGTNDYGFSALPGGYRNDNGTFYRIGEDGYWWSSTEYYSSTAFSRKADGSAKLIWNHYDKGQGFSVRCVRD